MKRLFIVLCLGVFVCAGLTGAQTAPPFMIEDLLKVKRVADPQLSPDGRYIVYQVTTINYQDNRGRTRIYRIDAGGGSPKALTEETVSASAPRWSPNSKRIAYATGGQIWTMDADGSDKKQVTKIATGAGNIVWSPDGKHIAFVSDVYPECKDDDCNKREEEKAEQSKVQAKVTERLLFRHWNEWRDRKRTHVFVVDSDGGAARDMTPGDFDSPPYAATSSADFAFSPDSQEIAYLRNPDAVEAISTNSDIYVMPLAGGNAVNITAANRGYDVQPAYSSDGRYIYYRSQATPAFEADRWRLMRYDRQSKQTAELTRGFDLQVEDFSFAPDGQTIYFTALNRGRSAIYRLPANSDKAQMIFDKGYSSDVKVAPDGTLVFAHQTTALPVEIFRATGDGSNVTQLTMTNKELIESYRLNNLEDVEWTGALRAKVHGFLLKPVGFDPNKKYPLMVLIHGGPQSAWNDNWSYRWNPQLFAAAGYVVFMPNPRGSTGYGQQFVNDISGDWGGKAYTDIMNGVADVLAKNSFIDRARIGGAGASYGGYMVDWILGHNTDPRFKFKTLVSHAGVFNLTSMAGVTEELWFTNWEFKGDPYTSPALYAKWSPSNFVKNFNTPTLVIHGEMDYRVPVGEGLQLYTALQRRGVKTKLLYFPDEGHWIMKPQNIDLWYDTVLGWLKETL